MKSRLPDKPTFPFKSINSIQDIVEYGFIGQKSLTCLDLSLGEFSGFKSEFMTCKDFYEGQLGCRTIACKNAVLTEEDFRKSFAFDRKLLYDYNLDVSNGLELNLRNATHNDIRPFYSSSVLINMIDFRTDKFETKFIRMLSDALRNSNQKVKVLHQISKMAKSFKIKLKDTYIHEQGFNILCFQGADSTVLVDFLTAIDLYDGRFFYLFFDVFKFVLHQANEARFNLWMLPHREMINTSIHCGFFVKTETIFQYRDAPRFCTTLYKDIKRTARSRRFFKEGLECPVQKGLMSKERHFLVLQMLNVFWEHRRSGLKALQMLWRSIPDAFLTVYDLTFVLNEQQSSRFIEQVCSFMEDVTGEEVLQERRPQPRKLQHNCRIVIRRSLSNNFQLATGIGKLKLPSSIKSFLRLEH